RRLDVRIDSPTLVPAVASPGKSPPGKRRKSERKLRKREKAKYEATLKDLISAGLLSPPLSLFLQDRGTRMGAKLLADGRVQFQGTLYDSCATAAEVARSTITGRKMNTNGWVFWQYPKRDSKPETLFHARQCFLAMKGGASGSG